jgi:ribosomal protein S18 acetylase RimI-like enzyme
VVTISPEEELQQAGIAVESDDTVKAELAAAGIDVGSAPATPTDPIQSELAAAGIEVESAPVDPVQAELAEAGIQTDSLEQVDTQRYGKILQDLRTLSPQQFSEQYAGDLLKPTALWRELRDKGHLGADKMVTPEDEQRLFDAFSQIQHAGSTQRYIKGLAQIWPMAKEMAVGGFELATDILPAAASLPSSLEDKFIEEYRALKAAGKEPELPPYALSKLTGADKRKTGGAKIEAMLNAAISKDPKAKEKEYARRKAQLQAMGELTAATEGEGAESSFMAADTLRKASEGRFGDLSAIGILQNTVPALKPAPKTGEEAKKAFMRQVAQEEITERNFALQGPAAELLDLDAKALADEGVEIDADRIQRFSEYMDPTDWAFFFAGSKVVKVGSKFGLQAPGGAIIASAPSEAALTKLRKMAGRGLQKTGTVTEAAADKTAAVLKGLHTSPTSLAAGASLTGIAGVAADLIAPGAAAAATGAIAGVVPGTKIAGKLIGAAGRSLQNGPITGALLNRVEKAATAAAAGAVAGDAIASGSAYPEDRAMTAGMGFMFGGAGGAKEVVKQDALTAASAVHQKVLKNQFRARITDKPMADHPSYGTSAAGDVSHEAAMADIKKVSPETAGLVNRMRAYLAAMSDTWGGTAELRVVPKSDIGWLLLEDGVSIEDAVLAEDQKGTYAGVVKLPGDRGYEVVKDGPDGQRTRRIYVTLDTANPDNMRQALLHEPGHLLLDVLPDAQRNLILDSIKGGMTPEAREAAKVRYNSHFGEDRVTTDADLYHEIAAELFATYVNGTPMDAVAPGFREKLTSAITTAFEVLGLDQPGAVMSPAGLVDVTSTSTEGVGQILSDPTFIENYNAQLTALAPTEDDIRDFQKARTVEAKAEQKRAALKAKQAEKAAKPGKTTAAPKTPEAKAAEAKATPEKPAAPYTDPERLENIETARTHVTENQPEKSAEFEALAKAIIDEDSQLEGSSAVSLSYRGAPKTIVPTSFEVTQRSGVQVIGTSPDKIFANARTIANEAANQGASSLIPYPTDNGKISEDVKNVFLTDVRAYVENQANGYRGDGQKLVRPENFKGYIPEENPDFTPTPIDEAKADFINLILSAPPPKTTKKGRGKAGVPGNVLARELREAQGLEMEHPAGRPEPQIFEEYGVAIGESNPLRNQLIEAGVQMPKPVGIERLTLSEIADVEIAKGEPIRAQVPALTQAGFLPKAKPESKAEPKAKTRSLPKVADVAAMTPDEFIAEVETWPSLTQQAIELGKSIKDPAAQQELRSLYERAGDLVKAAIAAKDMDVAMAEANRGQFFREAYEASTGTGGIGEYLAREVSKVKPAVESVDFDNTRRFLPALPTHVIERMKDASPHVKGADGLPKPFFHGTYRSSELIEAGGFSDEKMNKYSLFGPGIYFTSDPRVAGGVPWVNKILKWFNRAPLGYAMSPTGSNPFLDMLNPPSREDPSPGIYPAYLDIKNPFAMEASLPEAEIRRILSIEPEPLRAGWELPSGSELIGQLKEGKKVTGEDLYNYMMESSVIWHKGIFNGRTGPPLNPELVKRWLEKAGFDGIVHLGGVRRKGVSLLTKHDVAVVFSASQIISPFESAPPDAKVRYLPMPGQPRAIALAAIQMPDGRVFTGSMHFYAALAADAQGVDALNGVEGFITNEGEFLDREQAAIRALELGQATQAAVDAERGELLSENLLSNNLIPRFLPAPPRNTKAFRQFFKGSKVVDKKGKPIVLLHGTLGDFESFDASKFSKESYQGPGIYLTTSPADASVNYAAATGSDMANRFSNMLDRVADEGVDDTRSLDDQVKERLGWQHEGAVLPVVVSMKNPIELGEVHNFELSNLRVGSNKYGPTTSWDYSIDEEGNETGDAVDVLVKLQDILARHGVPQDAYISFIEIVNDDLLDGELTAVAVRGGLTQADYLVDEGTSAGEIFNELARELGYDGIIDYAVPDRFNMPGVTPDAKGIGGATHYVAFRPEQVKSVFNRGDFSTDTPMLRFAPKTPKLEARAQLQSDPLPGSVGGTIKLVHYSSNPDLKKVDPKFFGKGMATTTDLMGGNKSYFFVAGSDLGQDQFLTEGRSAYAATISGDAIYDLNADPLGIFAIVNREERDDVLQDAGFKGFRVKTADERDVVALFKPVGVTPLGNGRGAKRAAKFLPKTEAGKNVAAMGMTFNKRENVNEGLDVIEVRDGDDWIGDIRYRLIDPKLAQLEIVTVAPDFRKTGIGEALYREMASDIQARGADTLVGFMTDPEGRPVKIRQKVFGNVEQDELGTVISKIDSGARFLFGGENATGFYKAEVQGKTFLGPYDSMRRFEIFDKDAEVMHPVPPPKKFKPAEVEKMTKRLAVLKKMQAKAKVLPTVVVQEMDDLNIKLADHWKDYAARISMKGDWTDSFMGRNFIPLGEFLYHPALFANYPDAAAIKVQLDRSRGEDEASFSPDEGTIRLSPRQTNVTKVLLHEIQHAIQEIEGFAKGGSTALAAQLIEQQLMAVDSLYSQWLTSKDEPALQEAAERGIRKYLEGLEILTPSDPHTPIEYAGLLRRHLATSSTPLGGVYEFAKAIDMGMLPYNYYRRFAGEIESREVEHRRTLGPEDKDVVWPILTPFKHAEGLIPRGKAILRFLPKGETEAGLRRQIRERVNSALSNFPEALPPKYRIEDGKIKTDKNGNAMPIPVEYSFEETPVAKTAAKGIRGEEERKAAAAQAIADRLVAYAKEIDSNPAISAGRGWYSLARTKIKKVFGKDALFFAELLAATSPQTPVEDNFTQALEAYNQSKAGVYDAKVKKFLEGREMLKDGSLQKQAAKALKHPADQITDAAAIDWWIDKHDLTPTKLNGKRFNANSRHVLKVLAGVWREEAQGLKAPQFAANLAGIDMNATIDVWAARTIRRLGSEEVGGRWRILNENEVGVKDKDFLFAQEVYRRAAAELGMEPDSLQALAWFGEKDLYEKRGWTRSAAGKAKSDFASQLDTLVSVPAAEGKGPARVIRGTERGQEMISFDPLALKPKTQAKRPVPDFKPKARTAPEAKNTEFKFLPKRVDGAAEAGYTDAGMKAKSGEQLRDWSYGGVNFPRRRKGQKVTTFTPEGDILHETNYAGAGNAAGARYLQHFSDLSREKKANDYLRSSAIEQVKSGKAPGVTFTSKGETTELDGPVDVVTLTSENVTAEDLSDSRFAEFRAKHTELAREFSRRVVFGLFRLDNGQISMDVNLVLPNSQRELNKSFAKANGQQSIWDAEKQEVVETGGSGVSTLTTPDEVRKAAAALLLGEEGFQALLRPRSLPGGTGLSLSSANQSLGPGGLSLAEDGNDEDED